MIKVKLDNSKYEYVIYVALTLAIITVFMNEAIASTQTSSMDTLGFRSVLDTYVASEPDGYGVYEARESNVFNPGETLILYVEPAGIAYGPITVGNEQLYNIKMSADIIISDKQGNVLAELQDLPLANMVSHHQNKELYLKLSVDQQSPFPPGDYVIKYVVTDDTSGENFEIIKDVTISA